MNHLNSRSGKNIHRILGLLILFCNVTTHAQTPTPAPGANSTFETVRLSPDDEMPFSNAQNDRAAEVFSSRQEQVLNEVFILAEKLEEKKQAMIMELGVKRIQELRAAAYLPESNRFDRSRKQTKLLKLGATEFANLEWDSDNGRIAIGEAIYNQRAIRGERIEDLRIEIPGQGKAEPKSIDKVVFPRVVHEPSGVAFLLLPNEITFDSKHLQQYIARIRYLSNYGKGRPVVLLSYNHSSMDKVVPGSKLRYKFYDTPKTWKEKVQTWFRATYVAPNSGSAMLTTMSVLMQVATTEGISAAKYALGSTPTWDHSTTFLTAGFGTVFGLWGSFYYNLTAAKDPLNPASRRAALVKRIIISSASFAYTLQIMNHGIESVSLMTVGGWLTNLALCGNIIANNAIKDQYKLYSDIREGMGLNRGTVEVLGVQIKKNQMERTVVDQVSRTMKMLDLMKFSILEVPVGSFLFYSSYIWSQYLVLKYAEKVNYEFKDTLRNRWKAFVEIPAKPAEAVNRFTSEIGYHLLVYSPKELVQTALSLIKNSTINLLNRCNQFLKTKTVSHSDSSKIDESATISDLPFMQSEDGEWLTAGESR